VSDQPSKAGLYVSGALHAALLAFIVFGFASAPEFEGAPESIPVDTITQSQFNEIMKGERNAKPVEKPPAEPTTHQAAAEPTAVPTPPEPPPDLKTADEPPPPPPPRPATPPPPKPEPPPPPKPTADDAPAPPARPKEKPPDKFKPDAVAKLLEKAKPDEPPKPRKNYDPNAIAKLIGQNKAVDPAPPGAATPQGLPDQHAARMSPSLSAALDAWLTDAYLNCWTPPPTMPEGERYVAQVRVDFNADGSLAGPPALLNPPADPAWRAHSESALRAVLKCNPLHVPSQYAPYFEQWKTKTVHFDPQSALG